MIDPAESPDRQRIGLWKFLPDETKLFFANDDSGRRGILLHLPWDQSTPANEKLILHVRFVTPDGRVLKTSSNIRIKPPTASYSSKDPLITAWTRQDSRWIPEPDPGVESSDARRSIPRMTPSIPIKAELEPPTWRPIR